MMMMPSTITSTTTGSASSNNTDATANNNDIVTINGSDRISSSCNINGSCSDWIAPVIAVTVPTTRNTIVSVQPYEMCSFDECQERVRTNEISIFERKYDIIIDNDHGVTSNELPYDPCKVITKYRRSVASFDDDTTTRKQSIRPISALYTTIQYLIHHIYIPISDKLQQHQQQLQPTKQNNNHLQHNFYSYITTLNFIDDRIRAIQVDLIRQSSSLSSMSVINNQNSIIQQQQQKLIQYNIAKYYIVSLYIISDFTSKRSTSKVQQSHNQYYYEPTFSYKALISSLNSYWNIIDCCKDDTKNSNNITTGIDPYNKIIRMIDDEMLAYHIMILFNQQLIVISSSSSSSIHEPSVLSNFWYTFTELYRKITKSSSISSTSMKLQQQQQQQQQQQLPFVQYVMKLIFTYCIHGQWQSALQMILFVPSTKSIDIDDTNKHYYTIQDWIRFSTLIQCCMSSSMNYIRYQIIQQFNCSLMKNEQLSLIEVSRLLCYHPSNSLQECYFFCHAVQLPMTCLENIHDHNNNQRIPITTKDIDPLILSHINVSFKVISISPYNTIFSNKNNDCNSKVRTIDMDYYILHNILPLSVKDDTMTHSSSPSSTSLPTTATSIEDIVIPTTEWFYQRNIFS